MLKYHWWLKFEFIISFIAYFLWTSKMIILFYKSNLKLDLMRIGYIDRNLSPLKAHLTLLRVREKYFGPIGGLPNFFQDKYLGPSVHMGHRWINLIKVVPLSLNPKRRNLDKTAHRNPFRQNLCQTGPK